MYDWLQKVIIQNQTLYDFYNRSFYIIAVGWSTRTSIRLKQLAFYVNLNMLELSYRF